MAEPVAGSSDIVIVGGGLAGLACAVRLQERGLPFVLLESQDVVGGRLATETSGGFLLDRGFQVMLTAYPACRELLDYEALRLGHFTPGAVVRTGGRFQRLSDPRREPLRTLSSLRAPVGSFGDKLRVLGLAWDATRGDPERTLRRPSITTREALQGRGFTDRFVDSFLRPFLGGIFLERDLVTSDRWMEFVLRMFATGTAALPAEGMAAIPRQLADRLPPRAVRLGCQVSRIRAREVTLEDGETVPGKAVVLATDGPASARLLGRPTPRTRSVTSLYFEAPRSPVGEPTLVLNGEGEGPVHHLCVLSDVQPSYAPDGLSLISVSVLGDPAADDRELEHSVCQQLSGWYGDAVKSWRPLRTWRVREALPEAPLLSPRPPAEARPDADGLWHCGDHTATASIQGALESGLQVADALSAARAIQEKIPRVVQ